MMYESSPTTTTTGGWTKRRTSSSCRLAPPLSGLESVARRNNNNNGNVLHSPPLSMATRSSLASQSSSSIVNIYRPSSNGSGNSHSITTKSKPSSTVFFLQKAVFILLVIGVLIVLANSMLLLTQLMNTTTTNNNNHVGILLSVNEQLKQRLVTLDKKKRPTLQPAQSPYLERPPEEDPAAMAERLYQLEAMLAKNLSLPTNNNNNNKHDPTNQIQSCRNTDCQSLLLNSAGSKELRVVYLNDWDQPRFLCGKRIDSHEWIVLQGNDPCHEHYLPDAVLSTLFPVLPTRSNHRNQKSSLPPIELGIKGVPRSRRNQFYPFRSCDVNCYYQSNHVQTLTILRTIEGTNWEIGTSMEGPQYYDSLKGASSGVDQYLATTSLDSDIPMPYFSWDDYAPNGRVTAPPVEYDKAIKGAVFMARNCQSLNGREALVKDLIQLSQKYNNDTFAFQFRIDSVSRCLHNHDPPPTTAQDDKNEIVNQYLFYLAFENQNADDYITEKLWGTLFRTGAVPVYLGAANVQEHVPPNSIINVREFSNAVDLWSFLLKVAQNRTLYESYHAWRDKPLPDAFVKKYNFTHIHSTCRMCRWAFAKRYGWGWDHEQQAIQEADISEARKLCWHNTNGLLLHPFQERWLTSNFRDIGAQVGSWGANDMNAKTGPVDGKSTICELQNDSGLQNDTQSVLLVADGTIRRTIWSHDGIIDMFLHSQMRQIGAQSVVLEMGIPSLTHGGEDITKKVIGNREFLLQNGNFRFTVMTSQNVIWACSAEGIIRMFISLKTNVTFRMRILIEYVEIRKSESSPQSTYFGKMAAHDFFRPLEMFVVADAPDSLLAGTDTT